MAKSLTIKNSNNEILYPKTVSALVYDDNTGDTVAEQIAGKQDTLVSGTNIKTINNNSIIGNGNIEIPKGDPLTYADLTAEQKAELAQPATEQALLAAQYLESIQDAIGDLDLSQSSDDAIVALAAKQGALEGELNHLMGYNESVEFTSGYYNNSSKVVGDNAPGKTSHGTHTCLKLEVKAGDKVDIYAQANNYQHTVMLADTDNKITSLNGIGVLVNETITINADGWLYVNNMTAAVIPSATIIRDTTTQSVSDLLKYQQLDGRKKDGDVIAVHFDLGANIYPNTTTGYLYIGTVTNIAATQWMNLPKGTYAITCSKKVRFYQADTALREQDKTTVGDNILVTTITSGSSTRIDVTKNYVLMVAEGVTDNDDLDAIVSMKIVNITGNPAPAPDYSVPHVACRGTGFLLYLPLRKSCMIVEINRYSTVSYVRTHFGTSYFYLPYDNKWIAATLRKLTRDSEAECAIRLTSSTWNDIYIGGHMHGYEKIVDADTKVYIDGDYKQWDEVWSQDIAMMWELSTHTQLFESDDTTIIADVYKRWRVIDGKLHYFNRVVFTKSVHIARAQFSMFGILRKFEGEYLTNKATRNDDTFVYDTTDGWDNPSGAHTDRYTVLTTPTAATHQEQWGDVGYRVTQDILESNKRDNGGLFINTNNNGTYNKMYFELGSNFDVQAGDVLFSHAVLGIE